MAKPLFWISVAALLYTFIGYPLLAHLLARLRNRKTAKAPITPRASVVVACHNEATNIEARIKNLLESDYPRDRLEVIVVSDGSTDATAEIAARNETARVRVVGYPERRGKASALNLGVAHATGEIVVFADARQQFERGAIRELAANFADARVGAVSGRYVLGDANGSTVREGIGLYWQYEEWIRRSESRLNSVIGATGAIYAIRRGLWKPLPEATILDDVYTPMRIAMGGHLVALDDEARAFDRAPDSASREFSRKVRTLTGNYQLCQLMPRLLLPTTLLAFQFYSHKLARLAAPIFFLLTLAANIAIVTRPTDSAGAVFYEATLAAQLAFYASVGAGWYLLKRNRRVRLLNFAYVFSVMNAAALVGLFYFVFGKRDIWARVK